MQSKDSMVSVIIPVYNLEDYIEDCLDSVLKQTYMDLEIIVIDDGSVDKTAEIAKEYMKKDSRIQVICQSNQGVSEARYVGIKQAQGKYIAFIDGDDWIEPDMIKELVSNIGDAEVISSRFYYETCPGEVKLREDAFEEGMYEGEELRRCIFSRMLYWDNVVCPFSPSMCNKLFLTDKVKQNYPQVNCKLSYGEDAAFVYAYLLTCNKIKIIHKGFYHYRYREGSATHKVDLDMLEKIGNVYKTLKPIFEKTPMAAELLYQLQMWLVVGVCGAINGHMGFDNRVYIPKFMANCAQLDGKKIVLYGAGRVGQDFYRQLKHFKYDVILWVDRSFEYYQSRKLDVKSPKAMLETDFDIVFIAIENEKIAAEIKKDLMSIGVCEEKIIWREMYKFY